MIIQLELYRTVYFRLKTVIWRYNLPYGNFRAAHVYGPITTAEQFGILVRDTRKALGLTQPAVAASCGTGVRFIVDLERGKPTVELGKALRVARMLGIFIEATHLPDGPPQKG